MRRDDIKKIDRKVTRQKLKQSETESLDEARNGTLRPDARGDDDLHQRAQDAGVKGHEVMDNIQIEAQLRGERT